MKNRYRLALYLLACVCLITANVQAQFVEAMNIRLTARMPGTTNVFGNVTIEKMRVARISTKEILMLLGNATTNDFTGATLVTIDFGAAFEVRRGSTVVADVSEFFLEEASEDVFDETFNSLTGKDSYHGFWIRNLIFDDGAGNRFELTGLVDERFSASAVDFFGDQRVADTEIFNGAGTGTLNGVFTVYSGSILFSGRGIVTTP